MLPLQSSRGASSGVLAIWNNLKMTCFVGQKDISDELKTHLDQSKWSKTVQIKYN